MANTAWWVWYNVQSGKPAQVIQAATKGDVQNKTGFPPLAGPFKTKADAQHWIDSSPTGKKTKPTHPLGNPLSGLEAVGNFFNELGQANVWIRVGEVVLGLILITVGIAKMTNAVPIATKVASYVK